MTSTTTNPAVVQAVTECLEGVLGRPLVGITEATSIFHEIGLDSTGVLDLLLSLEERLDIEFDMEELEMKDFSTVGTFVTFVAALQGQ